MKCDNCRYDKMCVRKFHPMGDKENCEHYEKWEERPHGEWINEDYGIGECFAECSECGEETNGKAEDAGFGYDYSFPNFCPNCGAKMKGGDGEWRFLVGGYSDCTQTEKEQR